MIYTTSSTEITRAHIHLTPNIMAELQKHLRVRFHVILQRNTGWESKEFLWLCASAQLECKYASGSECGRVCVHTCPVSNGLPSHPYLWRPALCGHRHRSFTYSRCSFVSGSGFLFRACLLHPQVISQFIWQKPNKFISWNATKMACGTRLLWCNADESAHRILVCSAAFQTFSKIVLHKSGLLCSCSTCCKPVSSGWFEILKAPTLCSFLKTLQRGP